MFTACRDVCFSCCQLRVHVGPFLTEQRSVCRLYLCPVFVYISVSTKPWGEGMGDGVALLYYCK